MSEFELESEVLFFKPQNINIAQLSFSLFETVRKVERGDIKLDAEFQRKQKWQQDKKSKLIESIILDIPIQAIYLSEEQDSKYEIIDGQQRIRAIYEFINNKFKLESTVFGEENKNFKDLEPSVQRKIEDFQLVIFVVKKDNNPYVKFEIFERINTGAVKLNSQELRNCIYRNRGIPFIKTLVEEDVFKRVIKDKKVNVNAMQDQELVLRFMSFYYKGYEYYKGNSKKFLNDTLENYEEYSEHEEEFKEIFINTMQTILDVFGDNAFLVKSKHKINIALFEILTYSFSKNRKYDILKSSNIINKKLYTLMDQNQDFKESILSASTTTRSKTFDRFRIWEDSLRRILEENI